MKQNKSSKSKSSASSKSSSKSSAKSPKAKSPSPKAKKARTELSYSIAVQSFVRSSPTNLDDIIKAMSKEKTSKK